VVLDRDAALALYRRAAAGGHEEAKLAVKRIENEDADMASRGS
jgi:hypothetical protein